ncbi:TetR family transcriptional regulator [Asticcacaulis sp. ZE23SCel15]|uniref:TetR/AcrR family transcriptional regulator n=1 Tax=Asticcacaulis sp. ZE23SCel15 TaxID=3059027 RepID=UPI00265F524C|nr:TetR family transcriptional regulator [Asticcacaulis sp. ZE23SCel15]WKL57489.1 TetR family transcriptional regulator [Asticcacaulis sp. ZE23SCel15]
MSDDKKNPADDGLNTTKILDTARAQIRRHGQSKTNIVDIAKALGTSHTTIYRHFRSKTDVFDAIVVDAMKDEEALAKAFVASSAPASERLLGMVLALHRRKRERLEGDPEVYELYRRVLEVRPELVKNYTAAMTRLLAAIIEDGVKRREFVVDDVDLAAGIVRDAVTVYVHPAHVELAFKAGLDLEPSVRRMIETLVIAMRRGLSLGNIPD